MGPDPRQDQRFLKTKTGTQRNKIQKGKYFSLEPYTAPPKIPSKPKKPLISWKILQVSSFFASRLNKERSWAKKKGARAVLQIRASD
jgi:hypothetical protein